MSSQYLGPRKNPHPAPPMPETVGGKLATMPKLPFHEIGLTLEEIEKIEAQQRFEIAIGDDSDDVDEDDSDVSFASLTIDS